MSGSTPTTCARRWPATRTWRQVEREAQSAKEAGIEGVPCFIFGGKFAVSGAQAPEYLAEAIERLAQAQRRGGMKRPLRIFWPSVHQPFVPA